MLVVEEAGEILAGHVAWPAIVADVSLMSFVGDVK